MADYSYKRIDEIEVGDFVLSMSDRNTPEDGTDLALLPSMVETVFVHDLKTVLRLDIDGTIVDATPNHPFYVYGKGWLTAEELEVGDFLIGAAESYPMLINKLALPAPQGVYNLEVESNATYFVSKENVWVHNAMGDATSGMSTKTSDEFQLGGNLNLAQ